MSYERDQEVEVKFPLTPEQEAGDREAWPWLPGIVATVCGPDEWEVAVTTEELATEENGQTWVPTCFREASEIREPEPEAES